MKRDLNNFIKRDGKRQSIYSQVSDLLSIPSSKSNKNTILNDDSLNKSTIEYNEKLYESIKNTKKPPKEEKYSCKVEEVIKSPEEKKVIEIENKVLKRDNNNILIALKDLPGECYSLIKENEQLREELHRCKESNIKLTEEKNELLHIHKSTLGSIDQTICDFKNFISLNLQSDLNRELSTQKDIIIAFSDSSKMSINNNFESINDKIKEFLILLKDSEFLKKEIIAQKEMYEEHLKNKNDDIQLLTKEREYCKNEIMKLMGEIEVQKGIKKYEVENIEMYKEKISKERQLSENLKNELNYCKQQNMIAENKIISLTENEVFLKKSILEKESIIEKLPILNLYECQIKNKINEWFKSKDKEKLQEDISKYINDIRSNEIIELEISFNELTLLIKELKQKTRDAHETIEIQKNEIANSKRFYERKIDSLCKIKEKNSDSKNINKRSKSETTNEDLWKMFELSDL